MATPVTLIPITYHEIMILRSCKMPTAQEYIKTIRASYQKTKRQQQLYLHEYCEYEKIDFGIALTTLVNYQKNYSRK